MNHTTFVLAPLVFTLFFAVGALREHEGGRLTAPRVFAITFLLTTIWVCYFAGLLSK